ncbi:hypothetical protein EDB81DRAFT_77274 [Dactylonectria macrodidyma]|uniref:G domain-containing protein n=1 Tax=Dactylonectria macrodidyma TaxID=307937 RepID=A0A9P9EF12_9HYPO|nr:hypothetical protein EDB81DRAFT_77274 [Dactylonectria macrodidyma]
MSQARTVKRLVVLIDGSEPREKKKDINQSSIQRINQLIRPGLCPSGRELVQIPKYYTATGNSSKFSDRFRTKAATDDTAGLVKTIVKDVCCTLEHPEDELWLYGSGHGAFVARVVAGVVHRMGLLKQSLGDRFDEQFDATCSLIKAEVDDDYRVGTQVVQTIKSNGLGPPRIPFVGLFDTVKLAPSKMPYDISFVPSIEVLRHALAINESRSNRAPEVLEVPAGANMTRRSLIQAWFLGTTDDLCGGTANDGLSLYPLQWILLESIQAGLSLISMEKPTSGENPLALVFPQYAGNLPTLDGSEDIEWRLKYLNGIQISMFDLQSTHAARSEANGNVHGLKHDPERFSRGATRKVFGTDGLKGWTETAPYGTVIHPSLFCVLDRYPRYSELPSFKNIKSKISAFQDTCLVADEGSLAPWLQDMQLQASGVKAFRILVCGKTGVGKSTLINKVFGVEMTSESDSYDQGVHDINEAFESPLHPGLLIHDSRGWQAGSDTELELIAKFLRHRAFQEDPAKALHVIWFCVDADVSRIEEADKRTFATIAQFSHQVPVFVVGTKKDKLTGYRKMQLLEELMEKTDDYKEAKRLADEKANQMAQAQFDELRHQLSQIEHYKADGYCCLSKNDDAGVKDLLSQTLGLIVDERVRLFCVAAQVVDVEQKINSAITECMRLGTHAIRTAAVPLPCSGMIGTPTVSRLICEHVLQCFGFPKATPEEIEQIMSDVVMGNLKTFMKVSMMQFAIVGAATLGAAIPTAGIGAVVGIAGCIWGLPPTARMLLKCSCDMILILERSFRYDGKYVSVKQIEDAARYYTTSTIKTFAGKEKRLQQQVHDEIDELVPLKNLTIGFKFNKLRSSVEDTIYSNRFGRPPDYKSIMSSSSLALSSYSKDRAELAVPPVVSELQGDVAKMALSSSNDPSSEKYKPAAELDSVQVGSPTNTTLDSALESLTTGTTASYSPIGSTTTGTTAVYSPLESIATGTTAVTVGSQGNRGKLSELWVDPPELEGNTILAEPREELEGSMPAMAAKKEEGLGRSRWGKLSGWKIGSKKPKTK